MQTRRGSAAEAEWVVDPLSSSVEAVDTEPGMELEATEAQNERDGSSSETTATEVGEEDADINEVIVPSNGAKGSDDGDGASTKRPISTDHVAGQQGVEAPAIKNAKLARSQATVAVYTALEKAALWGIMYERRVKVSYTFEYDAQDLDMAVKKRIYRVLNYQFKFRQAIWERHHWVRLWVSKPDTTATKMRRVQRQSCALKEWRAVLKEDTNLVKFGLVSEYIWLEPFVWNPEEKPWWLPDGCSTLENIVELDVAEPGRVYRVNNLSTHPLFAFEMEEKYNKPFVL